MINPYDIINTILSENGFSNDIFSVKFKDTVNVKIEKSGDGFLVSFLDSRPIIKINKYISLSLTVNSILLKNNSGIFKIDYFPDIPFKYNWIFGENEQGDSNELR